MRAYALGVGSSRIAAVGVVASLVEAYGDQVTVRLEWFADVDGGERVAAPGHSMQLTIARVGIGSIVRRHRGPGPAESHRLGATDFEDAAREAGGLLSLREERANWISPWTFVTSSGGLRAYLRRRLRRWRHVRHALAAEGISATRRQLDSVPFRVELTPELERALS
jgi:hypothetical protein